MRLPLVARAFALLAACFLTGLLFFVHDADLATLGAHPALTVAMPGAPAATVPYRAAAVRVRA